jgi:hypothetical protein
MTAENDPASQATKAGFKTTEAWAAAIAVAAPLLGKLTDIQSAIVGLVVIAYILARAWTKNTVAKGAAEVAVSRKP